MLDVAAALCGVTSVVVQMLVPYAATLASDDERSRVIGTLMGGLLIGILLSRTFAGVVAGLAGWRAVYGIAAVLMALTAVTLRRALPDHGPQLAISYREQLRGVLDVARAEPALRWRSLIAACGFGSFACFWTTVTFLLAGPQYGFSQLDIGLFALVGAAGAITSHGRRAGCSTRGRRCAGRPRERHSRCSPLAYLPIGLGGAHLGAAGLALLVVGVLLMDACVQGSHVINQSVIYDLLPRGPLQAHHRLHHDDVRGRRARLGGGRPGLRALGLDRRHPDRGRVPRGRPALLAGHPPPRGLGQRPGEVGRAARRDQVDVLCELPAV